VIWGESREGKKGKPKSHLTKGKDEKSTQILSKEERKKGADPQLRMPYLEKRGRSMWSNMGKKNDYQNAPTPEKTQINEGSSSSVRKNAQ